MLICLPYLSALYVLICLPYLPGAPKCVCPSYPAPGGLFPRVRLLDLSNNGIGVAGARMLAAALASGDVKDRARVAVQYRLAKKRILSRAVQKYA